MPIRAAIILSSLLFLAPGAGIAAEAVDYNRDIRPLLAENCYLCHGPDEGGRQTEMRLDDLQSATATLASGQPAIAPHDLAGSELYQRVTATDDDLRMPPPDSGKSLSAAEIDMLRRWISEGAAWSEHWSFLPARPSRLPAIDNASWPQNPLDYFVLSRLQRDQWSPSPPADRRVLARRVSLSLTGLLPTLSELQNFLQDESPDAYDRLVDRLLHSPRYGEHQARYWLDAARYGDTHGLHLDNERSIWRYRDWVIDAYNRNLPFDQFTIEQLAGDLLPNATLQQQIATGFHRCNVTTSEGGAIAEEFLARYAVDRVETTATVWMGLTAGCAACHDHKFDPISQREFYQLYAYFYNQTENAMDGNALLPPPAIKAPTRVQQLRYEQLQSDLDRYQQQLERLRQIALQTQQDWEPALAQQLTGGTPPPGAVAHVSFDTDLPAGVAVQGNLTAVPGKQGQAGQFDGQLFLEVDQTGDFVHTQAFSYGGWVNVSDHQAKAVLSKMDDADAFRGYDLYLGGGKVFVHIVHAWDANAIRVNTTLPLRKEKWQHVFATYDGSGKARGVHIYVDGRPQDTTITHDSLTGSIQTSKKLKIGRRDRAASYVGMLDEVRVYERALSADEVLRLANSDPLAGMLAKPIAERTEAEATQLVDYYLKTHVAEAQRWLGRRDETQAKLARLQGQFPSTLVMQERSDRRQAYLLLRGQYDQLGAAVSPGVPQALPETDAEHETRLSLAKWLVRPDHPLTARVIVNRIWQQHFGVGLVKTSEDFGSQGEWPSQPELLDYLASELVRSDWDLKWIHRLIVTSATFQQSSVVRPELHDPENRLLARGPRFRLDAEVLRDIALSMSGLLVGEIGGPSVKPYQPEGLWEAVGYPTSTTARFRRDAGGKLYRRGLYTFWKRTSPPPSMQVLDAPTREVCSVRRPRTNTPGAALLLMNDIQYVEASRKFAERILEARPSDHERLAYAMETTLSRRPSEKERDILSELLADNLRIYARDPQLAAAVLAHGESPVAGTRDPVELAAWTLLANTLLNLDETINQH